jgi:hypothetical protein
MLSLGSHILRTLSVLVLVDGEAGEKSRGKKALHELEHDSDGCEFQTISSVYHKRFLGSP